MYNRLGTINATITELGRAIIANLATIANYQQQNGQ